jgi:hypothetical protein
LIDPVPDFAAGHRPPVDDLGKEIGDAIGDQQIVGDLAGHQLVQPVHRDRPALASGLAHARGGGA